MSGVSRSGRVSRQIPILLLGTDTSGRVFSEETRTLVLSPHGARILSRKQIRARRSVYLARSGDWPLI